VTRKKHLNGLLIYRVAALPGISAFITLPVLLGLPVSLPIAPSIPRRPIDADEDAMKRVWSENRIIGQYGGRREGIIRSRPCSPQGLVATVPANGLRRRGNISSELAIWSR
jgi:hypothetical protein